MRCHSSMNGAPLTIHPSPTEVESPTPITDTNKTTNASPNVNDKANIDDSEAANEHVRQWLPFSISEDEIGQRFGVGTQLYFIFIRFVAVINLTLFLVSLINWVPHLNEKKASGGTIVLDDLFTISYSTNQNTVWKTSGILQIILWFLFPIVYYGVLITFKRLSKNGGNMDHENMYRVRTDDIIPGNEAFSPMNKLIRRGITFTIFSGMVAASYFVTAALQNIVVNQRKNSNVGNTNGSSKEATMLQAADFGVSLLITIWNVSAGFLSYTLTDFEKWATYSFYSFFNLVKVFLFKTISVVAFYQAVYQTDICSGGYKFMTLMVTDLVIGNLIEYGNPLFWSLYSKRYGGSNDLSDEKNRPAFDLATEYVEILYRQYLLYLGSAWFPIISGFGFLLTLVEYPLDKFRMLRICQNPPFQNKTMRNYIISVLYVCALFGLVGSEFGPAFVYSRQTLPLRDLSGAICFDSLRSQS
ncbi:hypothetical protein BKA69DRAFT_1081291 [Paraphysoderma sedebokerense]|nr:hypothetical protein BKA69DRAFT_1081291 [Paraphysoderma sedebokerense]